MKFKPNILFKIPKLITRKNLISSSRLKLFAKSEKCLKWTLGFTTTKDNSQNIGWDMEITKDDLNFILSHG
jgi:hypothetical protein